uniref:Uncharacterized protein n=1 Tax=Anguilla anguilla TaxID=7936 RepID=A0A0E9PTB3_ANGAN
MVFPPPSMVCLCAEFSSAIAE